MSAVCWLSGWFGFWVCCLSLFSVLMVAGLWWRDIIRESTFGGQHTKKEQKALWVGFILFICSEAMLFVSLFWAFLHCGLAPGVEVGCHFPPVGIEPVCPWNMPGKMTALLVGSGFWANRSLHALKSGKRKPCLVSLAISMGMGAAFSYMQVIEYFELSFTMSDSVFGSCFFMLTGFHGVHVVVGNLFLFVQWCRVWLHHFSTGHHLGFSFSVWYWHFVDVVWLFVFPIVYVWGGWIGS
uniref:Cytochrome c oxidase subunit 3 n=1 Tax=Barbatia virescens TaxID=6559 RepID=A0A346Q3D6_9BIVA|nr:cytochrome coxidase subunit III [Barbatia virescens]